MACWYVWYLPANNEHPSWRNATLESSEKEALDVEALI
jgi:hypothetical protein